MSCTCHLCEPWNKLAQECDDAERLNELRAQRLAVHGLTPKELGQEGPSTRPNVLMRRRVEQRDGRMVVIDEAFSLDNAGDRERLRRMIEHAERNDLPSEDRTFPPFKPHEYSTPFFRAVLKDTEEQRLREYLRSRL